MRKCIIKANTLVFVLLSACFFSQKLAKIKDKDIIKCQDITVIEKFLSQSHPEDPRNPILRKRLIQLKNEAWVKGRDSAKPMAARELTPILPPKSNDLVLDSKEYENLLESSKINHKNSTKDLLNTLFDYSKTETSVALLIRNHTKCNIILELKGKKNYSLAIPKHSEGTIVVQKDFYDLQSTICSNAYKSKKELQKSSVLVLTESEIKNNKINR